MPDNEDASSQPEGPGRGVTGRRALSMNLNGQAIWVVTQCVFDFSEMFSAGGCYIAAFGLGERPEEIDASMVLVDERQHVRWFRTPLQATAAAVNAARRRIDQRRDLGP